MTPQELSELKSRCLMAVSQGYQIAHAESHIAELKKITGDVPLPPNPTRALLTLIGLIEAGKVAPPKVVKTAPKPELIRVPEPVKAPVAPKPPPAPEELHMPNIGSNIAAKYGVEVLDEDKADGEEAMTVLTQGETPIPLEEAKEMLLEEPPAHEEIPPPPPPKGGKKGKKN